MSTINLGGFTSLGGKTVSKGGLASGLDTEGLVNALVNARKIPVTKLEDKIEVNDTKLGAYTEMKSFLTAFRDASDALRKAPGFFASTTDSFAKRQAFITSNTSIAGNTYVGVNAAANAELSKYDITVSKLAKAHAQLSGAFTSKTASVVNAAGDMTAGTLAEGTFKINGVDVSVKQGDNLAQVAANINGVSTETNVTASIVQVGTNDYRLQLTSTKTGVANAFSITDSNNVISHIGLANSQAARDAEFTFNGISMTRSSNDISDIVDNVTFSFYQETPAATTVSIEIDNDTSSAKDAIVTFIGAYNDFMTFAAKQQERDPKTGLYKDTAVLGNDATLRTLTESISEELRRIVPGITSGNKAQLADAGITFTSYPGDDKTPMTPNILTLDETTLNTAFAEDFEGVRNIFAMNFATNSSDLAVYTRTNALSITEFSLNIDTSRATGDQVRVTYVDANGVTQQINADYEAATSGTGGSIIGKSGTVLEGLTLLYSGGTTATADVSLSQGIGDRVFNYLASALEETTGVIDTATKSIKEQTDKANEEITRLNDQIDRYRQTLLDQYAGLEDQIAQLNSVLQLLDAQQAATNSKN